MESRKKWRIASLAAAAVLVLAAVVWVGVPVGKGDRAEARAPLGYGAWIPVANVDGQAMEGCSANRAADQSGMSGAEAKSHTHGNQAGTMWCAATKADETASLTFDLGRVEPLGEMWVWNYNEENNSPDVTMTDRGLKEVKIEISADGYTWEEWQGSGYPFRFAKADGSDRLAATNLDDGKRSPVRFGGAPARFVRLKADPVPGKGNWAADANGERVFGLSEVRFYRFAAQVQYAGDEIVPVGARDSSGDGGASSRPENAVNRYGMSGEDGKEGRHGRDGNTMWLLRAAPGDEPSLTVDLGGTYPLGEMWIWNYNGRDEAGKPVVDRGLKNVGIAYSIDGKQWTELKGAGYPYRFAEADGGDRLAATNLDGGGHKPVDFGGVSARFVRLTPQGGAGQGNWGAAEGGQALYGISELRFFSGAGLAAEPAPEWTGMFSRYEGWTGADGIFSIPLDGLDQPGSATDRTKTAFLFSDTYSGHVQPISRARESEAIVNNSVALLDGSEPDPGAIRFDWVPQSADLSLFTPHTPESAKLPGNWYWLQDGIARDGKLILFPLLMVRDPAQPPGFQFAIRGVAQIGVPLTERGPDYAAQTQADTPLYRKLPDGSELVFGAGILDNTAEAGAPNPDGYIYVYGYRIGTDGDKRLTVARTLPAVLDDFAQWRYWDGQLWSERIEDAKPLLDGVSPELSVTPMKEGRWKGKYVLVCEKDSVSGTIVISVADSPAGPFGPMTPVYQAPEPAEGQDIITYNAKAHPHLSKDGELLVTYNVNSTSLAANSNNADIYHPRWIRIREIAASE